MASRTVARLTLSIAASSRSVGSRWPGTNSPSAIAVTNRSAIRSPVVRTVIGLSSPGPAACPVPAAPRSPPAPRLLWPGHDALPPGSPPAA